MFFCVDKIDLINNLNQIKLLQISEHFELIPGEEVDLDLDGKADVINHVDNKRVVLKEMLDGDGKVVGSRYYDADTIQRVEKDTTKDGKIDYWEFYEQGILDRIGRDVNADGRADSWTTR